ncbi:MAG: hypothetical protein GXP63_02790 [DPANN group archaeon]|nr:hypothetical protein [DPANN group archaeon]
MLTIKSLVLVLVIFLVTISGASAATLYVDDNNVCGGNTPCTTSIQSAINTAVAGDTIFIYDGTYPEHLVISKSLTLTGESEAGVIIDSNAATTYGISVTADDVVLKRFTHIGPSTSSGRYGLKISGSTNVNVYEVTVKNTYRTGVDLNGVTNALLQDITSINNNGNGISVSDSHHITLSNIYVSGNAWGGIALYSCGNFYPGGTDDVTITGTNTFGTNGPNAGLYTEEGCEQFLPQSLAYHVTNVHLQPTDFNYKLKGTVDTNGPTDFTWYYLTLSEANSANPTHLLGNRVVTPLVSAPQTSGPGANIGIGMTTEDFVPRIWMCDNRILYHNSADNGTKLVERVENYAFEGEQISWDALVLDKNGIEKIKDVYMALDGAIEANCRLRTDVTKNGCYGAPENDACTHYDANQCTTIDGCNLACDRYVDVNTGRNCDGNTPCHPSVQSAVDAASNAETICVYDGSYDENVNINKGITLQSISGAASTTISSNGGTVVTISSDDVVIDGFTLTNGQNAGMGIYAQDHSDLTIKNNVITQIGNSQDDVTGRGIVVVSTSSAVDAIKIVHNQISDITSGLKTGSSSTSSAGISIGWTSGTQDITHLQISCNTIYDIKADTSPWSTTKGQGAYGILINHGTQGGQTIGAQIYKNHIRDLEGLWAHGIGLEGDTPDAVVNLNEVSDLTDHKSPSDAVAVQFEDNPSAGTVDVSQNNFLNNDVGIQNTVSGTTVHAENNYWGCSAGPSNSGCAGISGVGSVDYTPWSPSAIDIPPCNSAPTPICEGTPSSCQLIDDRDKCDTETPGCRWLSPDICNARIDEEALTDFNPDTMAWYGCLFTVETPNSMSGEHWVTLSVEDLGGLLGVADEKEYWFLNPTVSVTVSGSVDFGIVRPGTNSYSDTLLIENTAEFGSGVLLDMAISGSDFYDPTSSGAKCPTSNVLKLDRFAYYATNGAHKTNIGVAGRTNIVGQSSDEGYFGIPYEVADPDMRAPIIEQDGKMTLNGKEFWAGNVLSPGAEIALTFRLALPEPCNGNFNDGSLYFWGTAI